MNSCLQNCKPGDIIVWGKTSEHIVVGVVGELVYARPHDSNYVTGFHSLHVRDGFISKIIKKQMP